MFNVYIGRQISDNDSQYFKLRKDFHLKISDIS